MAGAPGTSRYLWLLRHAKTLTDPPAGGADRDRRLAGRGERDATALGKRLRSGSLDDREDGGLPAPMPALVLASSAARTRQTAELLCAELDHPPPMASLDSLYAATPVEVLRQVARTEPDLDSVMVVGHNPTVRSLALELIVAEDRRDRRQVGRRSFDTCGLAIYDLGPVSWSEVALGTGHLLTFVAPPY